MKGGMWKVREWCMVMEMGMGMGMAIGWDREMERELGQ